MSRIKLYIAQSLDGYIAREDGTIDWLDTLPHPEGEDYGYGDFIAGIDIIVMGRKTYEKVLGFGVEWPYTDQKCYVVTSGNAEIKTPNTELLHEITSDTIKKLREESKMDIWNVGGGRRSHTF